MPKFKKKSVILSILVLLAVGGFAAYASLFSLNDFEQANGNIPYPGTWTFHYLEGPPSAGSGMANLSISSNGNWAVLNTDGQTISFYRTLSSELAMYQSPPYTDETGTAVFRFAANTPDSIIGTTSVNGVNSPINFTWAMELVDIDLGFFDTMYNLSEGEWATAYEPTENDCGPEGTSADFAGFSGMPSGPFALEHTYDFDTNAPDPNDLTMSSGSTTISMERIGATNNFGQGSSPIELGMPLGSGGDLLLDFENQTFTGQYEFTASGGSNMEGFLHVTSSGGCTATFMVDMSYTGSGPVS